MKSLTSKAAVGGALLVTALWLGGCATEDYVDKAVANVQQQLTGTQQQVAANTAAIEGHNGQLAKLDADAQAALAKAEAAQGQLAENQIAAETVNFDSGSAKLSEADQGKLADLANRLKTANKNVRLEIRGYTDSRGSPQRNEQLASLRAENVFQYLGTQGIPLNAMEMMSHGENDPAAPNDSSDGRAQNRRVVVAVMG